MFKTYKDKKTIACLERNPQNHEHFCHETSVCELKPIKIDEFNEAKEKEVKHRVEKIKIKRREVAEQSKPLKKEKTRTKQRN